MSDDEYLRQFAANVRGDYNNLPLHVPPNIRKAMESAMMYDDNIRKLDAGSSARNVAHKLP